jgi:inner membrane protein
MKGEQHVIISVFSVGLFLAPWIWSWDSTWTLLVAAGVVIGSLAPDADAPDAAILHRKGGKGVIRDVRSRMGVLLPGIGYVIRYLIYLPLSAILWILSRGRIVPHHRGLLHSVPGVLLMTLVLAGYCLLPVAWFDLGIEPLLLHLLCGFFLGNLLHLLEDASTRTGICWKYPFSRAKIRGTVNTGSRWEKRPEIFGAVLGGCALVAILGQQVVEVQWGISCIASVSACIILWMAFLTWTGVHAG